MSGPTPDEWLLNHETQPFHNKLHPATIVRGNAIAIEEYDRRISVNVDGIDSPRSTSVELCKLPEVRHAKDPGFNPEESVSGQISYPTPLESIERKCLMNGLSPLACQSALKHGLPKPITAVDPAGSASELMVEKELLSVCSPSMEFPPTFAASGTDATEHSGVIGAAAAEGVLVPAISGTVTPSDAPLVLK